MDTDSDDIPLTQLLPSKAQAFASDSDDDLPDWVKTHKSPHSETVRIRNSDSDDSPLGEEAPKREPATVRSIQGDLHPAAPEPESDSKPGIKIEESATAKASQQPAVRLNQTTASTAPLAPVVKSSQADDQPSQSTKPAVAVANVPGELLIEVIANADNTSTDLAGDCGAVGRVIVMSGKVSTSDEPELHLDLKGVLYKADILQLAGCAMVINIGTTEAKVESLVSDYVCLKQESAYELMGSEAEGANLMMDSDDENYQFGDEDAGGGGEEDKPAKKVKKEGPGASGARKKTGGGGGGRKPTGASGGRRRPEKAGGGSKGGKGKLASKGKPMKKATGQKKPSAENNGK
eukprot:gene29119-32335_t